MDKVDKSIPSEFRHPAARLFEFLPDVSYFVKDVKGRFMDANPGFVEMLGAHHLEDILGKTDHDFSPRELADHFVKDDREVIRTGRAIVNRVELVPNSDGSISWHVTSKVPLHNARGEVIGVAGFTRDLTKASVSLKRYRAMSGVMEYIEAHYAEPVTVGALAAVVHLSVSQFERKFRQSFQVTPIQYLLRVRINKACRMLTGSDAKITEIAAQCGFYDHSHFIRRFTRTIGIPPREYRKQHQDA